MLNSIGPVWDGNEVWLVLGGGVLFAVFPFVYASLFSGLLPRHHARAGDADLARGDHRVPLASSPALRWRSVWDVVLLRPSSAGLALLLGVAFGNVLRGVPLDAGGQHRRSTSSSLLSPFALLFGVTTVAMFALHGSLYLMMKTEGDILARANRWLPRPVGWLRRPSIPSASSPRSCLASPSPTATSSDIWPVVFPAAALGAMGAPGTDRTASALSHGLRGVVGHDPAAAGVGRHRACTPTCSSPASTRPTT